MRTQQIFLALYSDGDLCVTALFLGMLGDLGRDIYLSAQCRDRNLVSDRVWGWDRVFGRDKGPLVSQQGFPKAGLSLSR